MSKQNALERQLDKDRASARLHMYFATMVSRNNDCDIDWKR